ncbi:MAG: hypothetical protein K6F78_09845 [Bacteroidaceae bacterium]|nr:hypothetical protein [Bacteroidaceae bacterium]
MAEDKNKRLVNIEIEDDVKRLTITGQDDHDQVVMRQELCDEELELVTGGVNHEGYDEDLEDLTKKEEVDFHVQHKSDRDDDYYEKMLNLRFPGDLP